MATPTQPNQQDINKKPGQQSGAGQNQQFGKNPGQQGGQADQASKQPNKDVNINTDKNKSGNAYGSDKSAGV